MPTSPATNSKSSFNNQQSPYSGGGGINGSVNDLNPPEGYIWVEGPDGQLMLVPNYQQGKVVSGDALDEGPSGKPRIAERVADTIEQAQEWKDRFDAADKFASRFQPKPPIDTVTKGAGSISNGATSVASTANSLKSTAVAERAATTAGSAVTGATAAGTIAGAGAATGATSAVANTALKTAGTQLVGKLGTKIIPGIGQASLALDALSAATGGKIPDTAELLSRATERLRNGVRPGYKPKPIQSLPPMGQISGDSAQEDVKETQYNLQNSAIGSYRDGDPERYSPLSREEEEYEQEIEQEVKQQYSQNPVNKNFVPKIVDGAQKLYDIYKKYRLFLKILPILIPILKFVLIILVVLIVILVIIIIAGGSIPQNTDNDSSPPLDIGQIVSIDKFINDIEGFDWGNPTHSNRFTLLPEDDERVQALLNRIRQEDKLRNNIHTLMYEGVRQKKDGKIANDNSIYLRIAWLWVETGVSRGPDWYMYNCRDRGVPGGPEPTPVVSKNGINPRKWDIAEYCGYYGSGEHQVAGFQLGDKARDIKDAYNYCYQQENPNPRKLKQIWENSHNSYIEAWNYNNPNYFGAFEHLFGGDFESIDLQWNEHFYWKTEGPGMVSCNSHTCEAFTQLMVKTPCMAMYLNTAADSWSGFNDSWGNSQSQVIMSALHYYIIQEKAKITS